jgi:hypothetical protein
VGMVRPRGGRVALALVSLAGPILASLAALTAVAAIQVVSPGYWVTSPSGMASSCLLLYAVGHLLSLAPIAADGRNLARAIMGPKGGGPKCKTAGTEREDGREN